MNWLKARREYLRMSQDDLMARLQVEGVTVSRSTISNWETGRHSMPLGDPKFRTAICRVLRMSEKEVLKMSGFKVDGVHSEEAERAAQIVDSLAPEERAKAVRLLEALVG